MTTTAERKRTAYTSYGNVAYDPAYAPQREERGVPTVRPRERVAGRAQVRVRPAGYVAPTAVLGFVLVAVLAVMLVWSYVQITVASDQVVHLRQEASTLAEEHNRLMTDYELAFDLKTVEETVTASGAMVQPQSGQIITLDLSEPDSATVYTPDKGLEDLRGLWESLAAGVENILEFFR